MGRLRMAGWTGAGFFAAILILVVGALLRPAEIIAAVNWMGGANPAAKEAPGEAPEQLTGVSEMEVVGVRMADYEPVVVLKEKDGGRYLLVWIGPAEAAAIGVALEGMTPPRPLTADLLHSVLQALEGQVESITINDFREKTFYARILLSRGGRKLDVDSRPSDAIAIAIRAGARIYAAEKVLEAVGITPEKYAPKSAARPGTRETRTAG
ncbi:MAG: bifunctional nuclease family protein [Chloroflexi bacterium]|nr:bifunctional nuclease family protein [Chloroflexota bacterium]